MMMSFATVKSKRHNRRGWYSGPARRDDFPAKQVPGQGFCMTAGLLGAAGHYRTQGRSPQGSRVLRAQRRVGRRLHFGE
jgi:hypothetical protein